MSDIREAVFGGFDGLTSCLGVIAGLIATHATSAPHILGATIGLAIAATIGMGAGDYLSQEPSQRSLRLALIMGVATLLGSVLPAIPFAFGFGAASVAASVTIVLALGALIGRFRGYVLTFGILLVVAVLTSMISYAVA